MSISPRRRCGGSDQDCRESSWRDDGVRHASARTAAPRDRRSDRSLAAEQHRRGGGGDRRRRQPPAVPAVSGDAPPCRIVGGRRQSRLPNCRIFRTRRILGVVAVQSRNHRAVGRMAERWLLAVAAVALAAIRLVRTERIVPVRNRHRLECARLRRSASGVGTTWRLVMLTQKSRRRAARSVPLCVAGGCRPDRRTSADRLRRSPAQPGSDPRFWSGNSASCRGANGSESANGSRVRLVVPLVPTRRRSTRRFRTAR